MHARMHTQKSNYVFIIPNEWCKIKKKGEKYSLKCVVITTYTWNRSGEKMITSDNPFLKSYHEKMLNEKNGQHDII